MRTIISAALLIFSDSETHLKGNGLSARRVRKHRLYIAANRCPERPGLIHAWENEVAFDPMCSGSVVEWWECSKCHTTDW